MRLADSLKGVDSVGITLPEENKSATDCFVKNLLGAQGNSA